MKYPSAGPARGDDVDSQRAVCRRCPPCCSLSLRVWAHVNVKFNQDRAKCFISTPLPKVTLRVKCYLDVGRVLDTH